MSELKGLCGVLAISLATVSYINKNWLVGIYWTAVVAYWTANLLI